MIFNTEEYNRIIAIILFPENQIWKDILYLFQRNKADLEKTVHQLSGGSLQDLDELEVKIFKKIEAVESKEAETLFKLATFVVQFVIELEEYFNTDLEFSSPEVRILHNMLLTMGPSAIHNNSFKKVKEKIENHLANEIQGSHNPSTITALNSIINATDPNAKSAAFHSIKEAVNTWVPYFMKEYSSFGQEDREIITKALRFTFLHSVSEHLIKL